jgi:hypothetical protein
LSRSDDSDYKVVLHRHAGVDWKVVLVLGQLFVLSSCFGQGYAGKFSQVGLGTGGTSFNMER